jgi:hypothetical protein
MGFHSGMSAIEIKLRTSTGTHCLDGISQWHVSNWNQAQNINWHSQAGWDFTGHVAIEIKLRTSTGTHNWMNSQSAIEIKLRTSTGTHSLDGISQWHVSNWSGMSSSEHQLALTPWMGFHSGMSAIEIKLRTSTGTHMLDGISQWHVSNWNQAQNINWHSLSGWDFTVACQQLKSSSEHQLALTPWMGFHSGMSAIEIKLRTSTGTYKLDGISQWACQQLKIKLRTSTGTHCLDGISQWHVSNWNQAQNINWHSLPGWNFTVACQQLKSSSEHQLALTSWMGFHSGMSAIEIKLRTSTGTHILDGISQWHVSNWNQAQNINWHSHTGWDFTGFYASMSTIQIEL